jgi:hypothetical protein
VSNTANFDFCAELGIATVREIFHLAFKQEDIYPHNVGPFTRTYAGQQVTVNVRVLDDETDPADLSFTDEKHMTFSFPFEIKVDAPGSPDPALSHLTMRARVSVPAALETWTESDHDVLGLTFEHVTPDDATVDSLEGLPTIGEEQFRSAVHGKYSTVTHAFTQGQNRLNVYDGTRDLSLDPPWLGSESSEIAVAIETHDATEYLKVILPIWVHLVQGSLTFESYGTATFFRPVERTDTVVRVDMTAEPAPPQDTKVALHGLGHELAEAGVKPQIINALALFGVIEEPAPSPAAAADILRAEVADYLHTRKFPVYTPQSGQPNEPVITPVGFLLVDPGVLAVLFNRRTGTEADDHAPDDFLGDLQLALAVGRAKVDDEIAAAIAEQFPDLAGGGQEIHTDQGDATLQELNVYPEDPDQHDVDDDHLWVTGQAEVHIDCWPDPDVSFEGPILLDGIPGTDDEGGCTLQIQATAGDFDIDESCCDVFLDLIIPIVGWIMLGIIESTIDSVGGAMIADITAQQGRNLSAIPPVIDGVAQVTPCLTGLRVSSQGFVFPGKVKVRRIDGSFEDLVDDNGLPRPDP